MKNAKWILNDLRDYMDQDITAGQIPTGATGPVAQFLTGMPEWMNMTLESGRPQQCIGEPSCSFAGTITTRNIPP
jgi:hypothetical protein